MVPQKRKEYVMFVSTHRNTRSLFVWFLEGTFFSFTFSPLFCWRHAKVSDFSPRGRHSSTTRQRKTACIKFTTANVRGRRTAETSCQTLCGPRIAGRSVRTQKSHFLPSRGHRTCVICLGRCSKKDIC
uniref:Transmembrane protein n=1 Tax=Toxoplasma gondii COUG TaxID=1074873 RepID=A0A2G8YAP9_TOXGO|nr:hypothetical protein TGCOUG_250905 [Toxoplasma gondii COUG]